MQGIHRTRHLLEQLLALARYEAHASEQGEIPPVALDHATKEVVADLVPQALNRCIDLGFELVEPLAVRSEPVMLTALIRNLLDNALRHTPEGERVDIGVYRQDGAAILQIEDSGPGIASGDMDRIFEPFFAGLAKRQKAPALACRS
jgi:two-component system OmpR family sensor kinase